MTDTPAIATVNDLKKAHAAAVLAKIAETAALIRSEPDLWFGGLPPIFEDLARVFDHRTTAISQTFEIEA